MKKILLTFILGIFLISFISACGESVVVREPVRLIFQSNETQLNITVEYVNQSGFWVDNSIMVRLSCHRRLQKREPRLEWIK